MNKRFLLLEKCPNGILSYDNMFIDLVSDIEKKTSLQDFPNSIFYIKKNKILFKIEKNNNEYVLNFDSYMLIPFYEYGQSYVVVDKHFLKKMINKYRIFNEVKYYISIIAWACYVKNGEIIKYKNAK